jgi:hypothetical protein
MLPRLDHAVLYSRILEESCPLYITIPLLMLSLLPHPQQEVNRKMYRNGWEHKDLFTLWAWCAKRISFFVARFSSLVARSSLLGRKKKPLRRCVSCGPGVYHLSLWLTPPCPLFVSRRSFFGRGMPWSREVCYWDVVAFGMVGSISTCSLRSPMQFWGQNRMGHPEGGQRPGPWLARSRRGKRKRFSAYGSRRYRDWSRSHYDHLEQK